jgi:hypothetical protein
MHTLLIESKTTRYLHLVDSKIDRRKFNKKLEIDEMEDEY